MMRPKIRYPLNPSIIWEETQGIDISLYHIGMLGRTVLRLPKGLQSAAPTNTPGSAIAPRSNCHSAVCLISLFLITLEMIVPEKTPLGKVTFTGLNTDLKKIKVTYEIVQEPNERFIHYHASNEYLYLPSSTGADKRFPVIAESQHIRYAF